jgi:hypothetical protein
LTGDTAHLIYSRIMSPVASLRIAPLGCHRFALVAAVSGRLPAVLLTGDLETCRLAQRTLCQRVPATLDAAAKAA